MTATRNTLLFGAALAASAAAVAVDYATSPMPPATAAVLAVNGAPCAAGTPVATAAPCAAAAPRKAPPPPPAAAPDQEVAGKKPPPPPPAPMPGDG